MESMDPPCGEQGSSLGPTWAQALARGGLRPPHPLNSGGLRPPDPLHSGGLRPPDPLNSGGLRPPDPLLFLRGLRPLKLPRRDFATSQPLGSNLDRSPAAQWLSTRISLASRLPAAGCRFDPGCQPPAPGSQLPAAGLQGSSLALTASPRGGEGSQKSIPGPEIRLHSKLVPSSSGPALPASPHVGEGFQKSQ